MADFTTIPDSNIEPGRPTRSIDGLALRDNPIAIAEGAAGAPKIAGQQGPAVETGGIADAAVTNVKLGPAPTSGTAQILWQAFDGERASDSSAFNNWPPNTTTYYGLRSEAFWDETRNIHVVMVAEGVVTCQFQVRRISDGNHAQRILKNGATLASYGTPGTSFATRSVTTSVERGDVITFQMRNNSTARFTIWRNIQIRSSNVAFLPSGL